MDFFTMIQQAKAGQYFKDTEQTVKSDFCCLCQNTMLVTYPGDQLYKEAWILKMQGLKAFEYFSEYLNCSNDFFFNLSLNDTQCKITEEMKEEFKLYVSAYYFDIICSFENEQANNNVRILRLLEMEEPQQQGQLQQSLTEPQSGQQEIILEVCGQNKLVEQLRKSGSSITNNEGSSEIILTAPKPVDNTMFNLFRGQGILQVIDEMMSFGFAKFKPTIYFDNIILKFTDPRIINVDICYLCGSIAKEEDLIYCKICQEGYHEYCVWKKKSNQHQYQSHEWICFKCKRCQICGQPPQYNNLFCNECGKMYHLGCVYKGLKVMPDFIWKCPDCFECRKCHTKNVLDGIELNEEFGYSGLIYFEFCEDFNLCYQCGMISAYYKFCKICKKYIPQAEKDDTYEVLECNLCKQQYHQDCFEKEVQSNENWLYIWKFTDNQFRCLECQWDDEQLEKQVDDQKKIMLKNLKQKKEQNMTMKMHIQVCESLVSPLIGQYVQENESERKRVVKDFVLEKWNYIISKEYRTFLGNLKKISNLEIEIKKYESATDIANKSHCYSNLNQNCSTSMQQGINRQSQEKIEIETDCKSNIAANPTMIEEFPVQQANEENEIDFEQQLLSTDIKDLSIRLKDLDISHQMEFIQLILKRKKTFFYFKYRKLPKMLKIPFKTLPTLFKYNVQRVIPLYDTNEFESIYLNNLMKSSFLGALYKINDFVYSYPKKQQLSQILTQISINEYNNYEYSMKEFYYSLFFPFKKSISICATDNINQFNAQDMKNFFLYYLPKIPTLTFIINRKHHEINQNSHEYFYVLHQNQQLSSILCDINERQFIYNIMDIMNIGNRIGNYQFKTISTQFGSQQKMEIEQSISFRSNQQSEQKERVSKNLFQITTAKPAPPTYQSKVFTNSRTSQTIQNLKQNYNDLIRFEKKVKDEIQDCFIKFMKTYTPDLQQSGVNNIQLQKEEQAINYIQTKEEILSRLNNMLISTSTKKTPLILIDELSTSAADILACVLCKELGNRTMSGRLIPFENDKWVHCNCALMSDGVTEDSFQGTIQKFDLSYQNSLQTVFLKQCVLCSQLGATITCANEKCKHTFHFPCSLKAKCTYFKKSKKMICNECQKIQNINEKLILKNFSTSRRLYIKGQQELNLCFSQKESYFIRIGALTLINVKKFDDDIMRTKIFNKKGFSEYKIMRRINNKHYEIQKKKQENHLEQHLEQNIIELHKRKLLSLYFIYNNSSYIVKINTCKKQLENLSQVEKLLNPEEQGEKQEQQVPLIKGTYLQLLISIPVLEQSAIMLQEEVINNEISEIPAISQQNFLIQENFVQPNQSLDNATLKEQQSMIQNSKVIENVTDFLQLSQIINKRIFHKRDWKNFQLNIQNFYGEFLGFTNPVVRQWIQYQFEQSVHISKKKEITNFFDYFFNEEIIDEKFNPFERQELFQQFHENIGQNLKFLNNLALLMKSNQPNPRFINLTSGLKNQMIQQSKNSQQQRFKFEQLLCNPNDEIEQAINFALQKEKKAKEEELQKQFMNQYTEYCSRLFAEKRVFVAPSRIHKYGLYAKTNLNKGEIIVEYTGEVIRNVVADKREHQYESSGFGGCYMFRLDDNYVIDATFSGNEARFLNHSCNPNSYALLQHWQGNKYIIIIAKRNISIGEEITYDYQFDIEANKISCSCGEAKCKGTLN